jgi:hypothetical protein
MRFYLVDVKEITSDIPRSNFDEAELETIAELIIESGGLIKPLVLKQSGAESYKVVEGNLEYYAAVRAKEKNPRQCEMVNAFVISPKIENLVLKQVEAIIGFVNPPPIIEPGKTNLDLSRLNNLEFRLEKVINDLKSEIAQERQKTDDKFKEINQHLPKSTNPLQLLNSLNKEELSAKLQRSRIPSAEAKAKAIIEARNKKSKQEFEDYRDVQISVKGLGEKTLLTIIDEWCRN